MPTWPKYLPKPEPKPEEKKPEKPKYLFPKIETSVNRSLIDDLLNEGKSSRFISKYLNDPKRKHPEVISHSYINKYKNEAWNIDEEAATAYREKEEARIKEQEKLHKDKKDKAVQKKVKEIEYCDDIIRLAKKVCLQVDDEKKITALDIKKLGLEAVKTKNQITKGDPPANENHIHIHQEERLNKLRTKCRNIEVKYDNGSSSGDKPESADSDQE